MTSLIAAAPRLPQGQGSQGRPSRSIRMFSWWEPATWAEAQWHLDCLRAAGGTSGTSSIDRELKLTDLYETSLEKEILPFTLLAVQYQVFDAVSCVLIWVFLCSSFWRLFLQGRRGGLNECMLFYSRAKTRVATGTGTGWLNPSGCRWIFWEAIP